MGVALKDKPIYRMDIRNYACAVPVRFTLTDPTLFIQQRARQPPLQDLNGAEFGVDAVQNNHFGATKIVSTVIFIPV